MCGIRNLSSFLIGNCFCEEDVIGLLLEGDLGIWVKNSTFHDLVINTNYSVCYIERSTLIS